jgi:hypothetical protein
VTVLITDDEGHPLRSVRYRAELPDGTVREGRTNSKGGASIQTTQEGDVKITIPELNDTFWDRH